jgi:hypothetical protein
LMISLHFYFYKFSMVFSTLQFFGGATALPAASRYNENRAIDASGQNSS